MLAPTSAPFSIGQTIQPEDRQGGQDGEDEEDAGHPARLPNVSPCPLPPCPSNPPPRRRSACLAGSATVRRGFGERGGQRVAVGEQPAEPARPFVLRRRRRCAAARGPSRCSRSDKASAIVGESAGSRWTRASASTICGRDPPLQRPVAGRRTRVATSSSRSNMSAGVEPCRLGLALDLQPVQPVRARAGWTGSAAPPLPRRRTDRRPGRRRCGKSRSSPAGPDCPTSRPTDRGAAARGTLSAPGSSVANKASSARRCRSSGT